MHMIKKIIVDYSQPVWQVSVHIKHAPMVPSGCNINQIIDILNVLQLNKKDRCTLACIECVFIIMCMVNNVHCQEGIFNPPKCDKYTCTCTTCSHYQYFNQILLMAL